jgi:hypothetical protein
MNKALEIQGEDIRILEELVSITNDTNTLGAATLNEMEIQSEKLGKIDHMIEVFQADMKQAGKSSTDILKVEN